MANSKQAKKRVRRNANRTQINRARRGRIRTSIKMVEAAIEAGDKAAATEALRAAQPEVARGVTKGVLNKRSASRKLSRLARSINAAGA